jgi:NAD-dependent deacetylase
VSPLLSKITTKEVKVLERRVSSEMQDRTDDALSGLEVLLKRLERIRGKVAVLTGAGISAESGIPTFRGPEGYWTVGSTEYRPEQMATEAMFALDPWEVWSWYLYRRTVCRHAEPNAGHLAVARMEELLGDRFRLITQNVDGLHLRAGSSNERTFQIHGNLHFMRCKASCSQDLYPVPTAMEDKGRNQPLSEYEKTLLVCPACGGMTRPHVLWFDEFYNEHFYAADSAIQWASRSDLLLVVGTAGATNLPMQIGRLVSQNPEALLIDVNPSPNPFQELARSHPRGVVLQGNSGELLPEVVALWETVGVLD